MALKKAAETAGVPVVNFSETLPDGQSYLQWMTGKRRKSIGKALRMIATAGSGNSLRGKSRKPTLTPVVSLRGASLAFGQRTLWEGLDLDINPGEFFAVLGPNGSGKTTFLKVLLGLQELSTGNGRARRPSR